MTACPLGNDFDGYSLGYGVTPPACSKDAGCKCNDCYSACVCEIGDAESCQWQCGSGGAGAAGVGGSVGVGGTAGASGTGATGAVGGLGGTGAIAGGGGLGGTGATSGAGGAAGSGATGGCPNATCSPGSCLGTNCKCYGPCFKGSCTTAPIGECSAPSPGGVYCCCSYSTPAPAAFPCTTDANCLSHKCHPQYGRCTWPCQSDCDCVDGYACQSGGGCDPK